MRILAVDDDETIVQVVSATLQAHGYQDVVCAYNGEHAVQVISEQQQPFDCFLFDVQMPGMNGIDLCSHVRTLPEYASSPVIMLTAMNDASYIDRAFSAGASDYVPKPFETAELVTRVRLAERQIAQEVAAAAPPPTPQPAAPAQSAAPAQPVMATNQAAPAAEPPKLPYNEPIAVRDVKRVVNAVVLKNYAMLMMEQSKLGVGAIGLAVPELELVHSRSAPSEFGYVVADISEVISDILSGSQSFISYVGGGQFLCVGPKSSLSLLQDMSDQLNTMLNDQDLVYCEDVATGFTAILGEAVSPKLLENRTNLKFLDRAVESIRARAGAAGAGGAMGALKSTFAI